MKSFYYLDRLIAIYRNEGFPPTQKELETLRAQFALDVAPFRELAIFPPLDEIEVE